MSENKVICPRCGSTKVDWEEYPSGGYTFECGGCGNNGFTTHLDFLAEARENFLEAEVRLAMGRSWDDEDDGTSESVH